MIKLRNFWMILAMCCTVTLGTASCSDDDDDDDDTAPSQEQINQSATDAAKVMSEVVAVYKDSSSNLLAQATSMTQDELKALAQTIVEYNANKDNEVWLNAFLQNVSQDSIGKSAATEMLDETINKLEKFGVVMDEITSKDLLDAFSEYFSGKDTLGDGKEDGIAQGANYKDLFNAVYAEKLAPIDITTEDGLMEMMGVFQTMDQSQQKELVNVVLAWANKSDDADWQEGFMSGIALGDEASQADLVAKLNYLAQYKDFIAAMA